ncbi:MAG: accessory factor UbiK family protein [Gammaproteobacteria bacterium]|nr:accessory factor UbiK family protein [Gammaproteobacteria bacterium]
MSSPFDELINNVLRNLPQGLAEWREDVKHNLQASLAAGLNKLDLVNRTEFEVQRQLLERAQLQLKVLEDKLSALEELVRKSPPGSSS